MSRLIRTIETCMLIWRHLHTLWYDVWTLTVYTQTLILFVVNLFFNWR